MEFLIVILFAISFAVLALYVFCKMKFRYWSQRGVLYLEPTFPFGNVGVFGRQHELKDTFNEAYQRFKGKTAFVGFYVFARPTPLIVDLDLVQHVLIKDFNKFHDRGSYYNERDDPLSAHLVSLHGAKWRRLRSKMTPTFTSGKIKWMFPTIMEVVKQFDRTLRELLVTKNDLEVKELLARFTTDVIGTCAFGIDCNSLKDDDTEFRRMGRLTFGQPRHSSWMIWLLCEFPDLFRKLHVKNTRDDVSCFFLKAVRETVAFRERNNVRRQDFMDLLIQLKNGSTDADDSLQSGVGQLTMEEIAAQAFIFFLAGFETSSTNMGYTLYELAKNPEIQNRARLEIYDVLEKHDGQFTYEAMMDMKYIDWIVQESLRKYPPIVAIPRIADCDYKVPNTEFIIEKGLRVFIPIYSIHHDPDIYPDPHVFSPDRFSPEEMKKRHPMSFLAFGDGPRNCIGARFGMMQSRMGLVMLLRNYRFNVCSKTPEKLLFTNAVPILTSKGGLWLNVEKVDSFSSQ